MTAPGPVNFNAQHAAAGAFMSLTVGHFNTRGGLAAQVGRPGNQDVFIGFKEGDRYAERPLRCLPFYEGAQQDGAAAYLARPAEGGGPAIVSYGEKEIERHYGWGIDGWETGDFRFRIATPFESIADPATASAAAMRRSLLPAVTAELRIDNRQGRTTKTGFFALGLQEAGARLLDEGLGEGRVGFGFRREWGVAAEVVESDGPEEARVADGPFVFMRWSPQNGLADRDNPVHLLGACPGIGFETPVGKCYTLRLALGVYLEGIVTTRLEGRYLYTRYYADLRDVLAEALEGWNRLWRTAEACDETLRGTGLSEAQQFLIAHATRSYYGSTQLLEVGGQPFWIVNEGEYCMMNTLDLAVDQVFWELRQNPWVVRNLLDHFAQYYAYQDQVKDPASGERYPGGISFCHDMGANNQFSPLGRSSYELAELTGCFSYMTQEQLCNWILMAASYVARTRDLAWARRNGPLLSACFESMLNRDHPQGFPQLHGVMSYDAACCGMRGQEITTYDSLDASLGQARGNVYLAVKCWAAYLGLAQLFECLENGLPAGTTTQEAVSQALDAAAAVARRVVGAMTPEGVLPAVLDSGSPGHHSRILPACEGLIYPYYWSRCDGGHGEAAGGWLAAQGPFAGLLETLRRHTATLLQDQENRNRFADGGLRLSSTSDNSWMSKIALFQQVCRAVLRLDERGRPSQGRDDFAVADAAHAHWQIQEKSAYWACSDQMVEGVAAGSRYYPRIVTTCLWMM